MFGQSPKLGVFVLRYGFGDSFPVAAPSNTLSVKFTRAYP